MRNGMRRISLLAALCLPLVSQAREVLVEAESFTRHGGWSLDTQFIDIMGSPYLLAHGLGEAVENATTQVTFPEKGEYHVWVRTLNWVEKFSDHVNALAAPGRFQIQVGDTPLDHEFGTEGREWHWEKGGTIRIENLETTLTLRDLTGFEGRCDAILFSTNPDFVPDNSSEVLPTWRREMLGIPAEPIAEGPYDVVFIGGGYAGTCGAIAAARMGLKVALVQNRSVLGGNGSSEVKVWAQGLTPGGLYPTSDIVRQLEDDAKKSPGTDEEFEDEKKLAIVAAEKNISLFLHHHAYEVEKSSETTIGAVLAFDTRTGAIRRFTGHTYCDSTGHGTIGVMAGADYEMFDGVRMGMSNMWSWENTDKEQEFPNVPWALPLDESGFPYPRRFHAEWFWESGFEKHPLDDLEAIRDWNFVANYGAWNALKNKGAYGRNDPAGLEHRNGRLTWMAYIGGPRETLQLLGDVVLSEQDILDKKTFPDGAVLTTWGVDLHYPREQYADKFPDNPFISRAEFGEGVDRRRGYPVPYRCFYSRNIDNLFMAGRNISVTHEALGTVRVMKTGGMMGVVVGKAAAVAAKHKTTPRGVYENHLAELVELLKLPGHYRKADVNSEAVIDPNLPDMGEAVMPWILKKDLSGIVVDDADAKLTGRWSSGAGLKPLVEDGYRLASPVKQGAKDIPTAVYSFQVPEDGRYEVRMNFQGHENRSSKTPVTVSSSDGEKTLHVNQQISPPLQHGFYGLGVYEFQAGEEYSVTITSLGTDGYAHIDAIQVLETK
ncbi:MAG: FAD-dependent oxidoreductase [Verrucomicrobiaceae bacterium]|nr:FAD-dependent oxidoreductase [Verrucomicrobiaceae bacterium]